MGVLRVNVGGQWIDVGAGGSADEVFIGPDDPIATTPSAQLWYDTDAAAVASAPLFSGRNLLDNGQFNVKQRTATNSPNIFNGNFLTDRWSMSNNIGSITAFYTTMVNFGVNLPAGRPRPANIQYIQVVTAVAAASVASNGRMWFQQGLEGQNMQHLNWGTPNALPVTLSFDVYSSIATTYVVELFRTSYSRSISALLTVPAGWSTQTKTFPGDQTTLTAPDVGPNMYVGFYLGAGSLYTSSGTLQTTWGSSSTPGTNRYSGISNNFAETVGNIFAVTNVQLEVGTVATPYEVRRYDDELRTAMRYYRQTDRSSNLHGEGGLYGVATAAGQNILINMPYPVPMRATPSVSIGGAFTLSNCTGPSLTPIGLSAYCVYIASVAAGQMSCYSNNNGYLIFNAEM